MLSDIKKFGISAWREIQHFFRRPRDAVLTVLSLCCIILSGDGSSIQRAHDAPANSNVSYPTWNNSVLQLNFHKHTGRLQCGLQMLVCMQYSRMDGTQCMKLYAFCLCSFDALEGAGDSCGKSVACGGGAERLHAARLQPGGYSLSGGPWAQDGCGGYCGFQGE